MVVGLTLLLLLSLFGKLYGSVDVSLQEVGPSNVLIYLEVLLVMVERCLVRLLCMLVVLDFLVKKPDLQ